MPIIDKLFPEGTCRCGRATQAVHCPSCGSTNCERRLRVDAETLASLSVEQQADAKKHRWWFCKRCYLRFNDVERTKCEAPVRSVTKKMQQASEQVGEVIQKATTEWTVEERKAKLAELFKGKTGGAPK